MSTPASPRNPLVRFFSIETELEQRNFGLDVMRAIGMIMVLTGHSLHFFEPFFPKILRLEHFCINGVELFFALSGFLIGNMLIKGMIARNDFSGKALYEFCRRRWYKTLPVYYIALLIVYLNGYFITGYHHDFSWKHLLFLQNVFAADSWFFPISYSLAIEEWFYILFPLLFLALVYLTGKKVNAIRALFITCGLIIVVSVALRLYFYFEYHPHWDSVMRRSLLMRIDSSVYGVLLAALFYRYKEQLLRISGWLFAAGILLYMFMLLFRIRYPEGMMYNVVYFTVIPVSFVLLIPWFYKRKRASGFRFHFFTTLSLISFSFYLFHLSPLAEDFTLLMHNTTLLQTSGLFLLYLLAVLLVSVCWYKYVEMPFTNLRERK